MWFHEFVEYARAGTRHSPRKSQSNIRRALVFLSNNGISDFNMQLAEYFGKYFAHAEKLRKQNNKPNKQRGKRNCEEN